MDNLSIIVPIKEVPDIEKVNFDRERGRIDRSSATTEPNPFDLNALEEAVKIKEDIGGNITVISMGPPQAEDTLRDAIARGGDRAILLTDKGFAGSDTWATSYTLATAIKELDHYDLIICGEKTVDGDTGQVGPEIAEILDIPHISYVSKTIERSKDSIILQSEVWGRLYRKELEFPGLITVTKDLNEPRLPTLTNKLKAKNIEIEKWGLDDILDIGDETQFGIKGSPTSVINIEVPKEKGRKSKIFEGPDAARKMVEQLRSDFGGM